MSSRLQRDWAQDIAAAIRLLPDEWDPRCGAEFDALASDKRIAIQKKRVNALSVLGRLLIRAILDHEWRLGHHFIALEDKAHWARQSERTKPYERGAIQFVGQFLKWCRDNAEQLPSGMPPFVPLRLHAAGVRAEDVSRVEFVSACDAIAWLIADKGKETNTPSAAKELSLTEAAQFYADLTGTKPDKGNTLRRLRNEEGKYTLDHIAVKARDAVRRKGGKKRRELMSEADTPQTCNGCGRSVVPPQTLWGSGDLCTECKYNPQHE